MKQAGILGRLVRGLTTVAAVLLITAAVVVGLARLLLPMVPEYQDDIRRFATAATGLDIRFARLSASWPLPGPELTFSDVRITTLDGRPVLAAAGLTVGVDVLQVVRERRISPGRVRVQAARIRIERRADGTPLVNGVSLDELLRPAGGRPPELRVDLRDIGMQVADPRRRVPEVEVHIERLRLDVEPDLIAYDGAVEFRDGLGRTLALAGTLPASFLPGAAAEERGAPRWGFTVNGEGIDVPRVLTMALDRDIPLRSGRGRLRAEAEFIGTALSHVDLDVSLDGAVIRGAPGGDTGYRMLGLRGQWTRTGDDWQARIGRLLVQQEPASPPVTTGLSIDFTAAQDGGTLSGSADNLPVQELWPLAWALAPSGLRAELLPEQVTGRIRDLSGRAVFSGGRLVAYRGEAAVADLGFVRPPTVTAARTVPGPAVLGVTGRVRADETGGRITLRGGEGLLRLPAIFRDDLPVTATAGVIGWTRDDLAWEVVGEDLRVSTPHGEGEGRVQVRLPHDGSSPWVDITARARATSATGALAYVPLRKLPAAAVSWLEEAIVAGSIPRAEVLWQGPLRGFPYGGGEGRFRLELAVTGGVLRYAPEWPQVEALTGTLVMDGPSIVTTENRGTLAGLPFQDAEVRIPSVSERLQVEITAAERVPVRQILTFLRQSPVADALGPVLGRVTASGAANARITLVVPVRDPGRYRLRGTFEPERASLGLRGLEFGLTDLTGTVRLQNTKLLAAGVTGRFLDEPVRIDLRPAASGETGLSHVAELRGTTPAGKLAAAFSLPYGDRLDGPVTWQATARVPVSADAQPLEILAASDLRGLASTLGPPLSKAPDTPDPMHLSVRFPEPHTMMVEGSAARGVSWNLRFLSAGEQAGWQLERGTVHGGRGTAALPAAPGLEISGRAPRVRFEDWFSGQGPVGSPDPGGSSLVRHIDLQADAFEIFNHTFRDQHVDARREADRWVVGIQGPEAAGTVFVPLVTSDQAPVVLDLDRLWLVEDEGPGGPGGRADPRTLPPVRVQVEDFVLGDMHFGSLSADFSQRGDGIVVEPLVMRGDGFFLTGDASWLVPDADPEVQRSGLRLQLSSRDILKALQALGFDPVATGRRAEVSLDLVWPGGPREDFLEQAAGRVSVTLKKGQFLPVEPGGGRLLGLLSVAALPRRLGMDFRDVLEKGLAFDQVAGEFQLENGNAFTCNLGLEGPVADMGIVGRAGFPNRDYDQLAVARPHVSDVLALGGAVVGGPVVGGTVLLISQIFRKPLGSLGESYYRITGPWEDPQVTRVQRNDVDITPFRDCERYLAQVLRESPPAPAPAPVPPAAPP